MRNQEYVLAIWREGGFTLAAERLHITQPAISRHIQDVESEIGQPLFDRSFKPVRLTQAGELYVKTAEEIDRLENDLKNRLRALKNLEGGTLRLGVTRTGAMYYLPEFLPGFARRHPDVRVELTEKSTAELEQMLLGGALEMTVSPKTVDNDGGGVPNSNTLAFQKYKRENCYLATPAGYFPQESGHNFTYEYAREKMRGRVHPMIRQSSGQRLRQLSDLLVKKDRLPVEAVYETSSPESAYKLCANGIGLAFTADSVKNHIAYRLSPDFYVISGHFRFLMLSWRKNAVLSSAAKAFLRYMDEIREPGM